MIFPDPTILISFGLFIIALLIGTRLVIRPVIKVLDQRHERIEGVLANTGEMEKEAKALETTYQEKIAALREKGRELRSEGREDAMEERKNYLDREHAQLQERIQEMKSKVEEDMRQVRERMDAQVEAYAQSVASKLLGRALN